jgi:hypothetical protein
MASYSSSSPYFTTYAGAYLDIINFRNLPNLPSDVEYEILAQYQYRPDLLAYDLYGNQNLWWVFAVRNKDIIKDPVFDMYPGQKIRLPQKETILSVLGV